MDAKSHTSVLFATYSTNFWYWFQASLLAAFFFIFTDTQRMGKPELHKNSKRFGHGIAITIRKWTTKHVEDGRFSSQDADREIKKPASCLCRLLIGVGDRRFELPTSTIYNIMPKPYITDKNRVIGL